MANENGILAPVPIGTVAPSLTLTHTPQAKLALHSLRGQPVVLVFYPADNTSV